MSVIRYPILLTAILVLGIHSAAGQQRDRRISEMVEQRYPEASSAEAETYGEALRWLADHPVDINRDSPHRLARVPGLDLQRARRIVAWRETNKPFESLDELTEVEGIGSGTVGRLRMFATVGDRRRLRRRLWRNPRFWSHNGEVTVMTRFRMQLERREGYRRADGSGYRGDRIQYYQRLRYRSDHLDLNLTQQKDAGEAWEWRSGLDHMAGYASVHEVGRLRRLVAGNFGVSAGEGLLLGGGSLLGKGRNVLEAPVGGGGGLKPFGSSRESGYLRGVGFTCELGKKRNIELTGWGSRRNLDARVLNGDTVRYSTETGYHRTATEMAKKDILGQTAAGAVLTWHHSHGVVQGSGYYAKYDNPVALSSSGPLAESLLNPRHHALSVSHQSAVGPWQGFGEFSVNREGGWGLLQGVQHSLTPSTGLVVAYRQYHPRFHSLFGTGFGESPGDGESGVYVGISHQFSTGLRLNGYLDQYQFSQPRHGYSRPSRGYDWLMSVEMDPSPDWSGYIQLKGERRQEEVESNEAVPRIIRRRQFRPRHTIRIHLEHSVHDKLRLRFRSEGARVHPPASAVQYGMLAYQDMRWIPLNWLQVDLRFTLFDTDDYASRVYQFENDLLYVMSNKMLHGLGRRSYVLLNLEPLPQLECWIKYGVTRYAFQHTIGSGLGKIEGSRQSKIGIQLRLRW